MKKFAAFLIIAAMVLTMVPFAVSAAKEPINTDAGTVTFEDVVSVGIGNEDGEDGNAPHVTIDGEKDASYNVALTGKITPDQVVAQSGKDTTFGGCNWYILNDRSYIYFFAEVKDADVVMIKESWFGDYVELFLPNNNGNPYCKICLNPADGEFVAYPDSPRDTTKIWRDGCQFGSKIVDGGYQVEVRIPLLYDGADTFDFAVAVSNWNSDCKKDGAWDSKTGNRAIYGCQQIADDFDEDHGKTRMEWLGKGTRYTAKIAKLQTLDVVMNFPEDVPDGSSVDIALAYADQNKYEAWGGYWPEVAGKDFVLHFVKGEAQTLELPSYLGYTLWLNSWAVVNDYAAYEAAIPEAGNVYGLMPGAKMATFVRSYFSEVNGRETFELSVKAEDCIAPKLSDNPQSAYGTMNVNGEIEDIYANGATYYISSNDAVIWSTGAYVGPANAIVHIVNDDQKIYIAAEVYENTIHNYGATSWQNDALEIWFPAYKECPDMYAKFGLDAFCAKGGLSEDACNGQKWGADLSKIPFAAKQYEDHYVVEIAVPIENLATNDAGNIVFSLQLDDFETDDCTVGSCFGVQANSSDISKADRELILAERPIIKWDVNMIFPDDVPNGTKVSIANGFADGKFNPEWGSGDNAWAHCAGQVLTFVKGEVDTLEYVDCPPGDCSSWMNSNWAICNDLEGYKATAWDDVEISNYVNKLTPVSAEYVGDKLTFTLKVNKKDCVLPGCTAHITMVFPDDVPAGATVALAHAFADGKMDPSWGSGDENWKYCAGQILTFVKGSVEELDYYGLPALKSNDSEWIFKAAEWAIANDAEGYAATAWDDVEIADYNIGNAVLQVVSCEVIDATDTAKAEAYVTLKVAASACVYEPETDAPETDAPETDAPETDAPETKGEDPISPVTADIAIVAAGLALAASAVVIFKKKH